LASRISGITPASISLLLIHLKKGGVKGFKLAVPADAALQAGAAQAGAMAEDANKVVAENEGAA
jgi:hypothetical protein